MSVFISSSETSVLTQTPLLIVLSFTHPILFSRLQSYQISLLHLFFPFKHPLWQVPSLPCFCLEVLLSGLYWFCFPAVLSHIHPSTCMSTCSPVSLSRPLHHFLLFAYIESWHGFHSICSAASGYCVPYYLGNLGQDWGLSLFHTSDCLHFT